MNRESEQAVTKIHSKGEARLDRVLDFVGFVARPMPLALLLDEAPRRIASIVGANVASLYLLEGGGNELVLRGNVGFPAVARGKIRLPIGEGITGMAVECLRPISVVHAAEHERYRGFPELGEDRFPVFLAVPILGPSGPLGALVVQRAGEKAFGSSDVHLAVALTAPIAAGLRHAQLLDELREKQSSRKTGGGTRKLTLPGVPMISGRALGAVAALKRPAAFPGPSASGESKLLRGAFDTVEKAVMGLMARGRALNLESDAGFLSNYLLILQDGRLQERAYELVDQGLSVAQSLSTVTREVARAANGIVGDPYLQERAKDVEDLCDAIAMLASPDPRAELPSKAVLVGDSITVFDILVTSRAQPVGFALSERAAGPRTKTLLKLLGVPSIIDVANLFRWASPGDVALLDADHGFLVINPSRAEVAAMRAARRKQTSDLAHTTPLPLDAYVETEPPPSVDVYDEESFSESLA